MGTILGKFRKEKSTQEILEALQENINTLENFTLDTQEQKKRVVGNFLASSIGLYIVAFMVFYFVYFPPTWKQRILYFIPLILFPVVIILLRYLFTWYYQRKLNKSSNKLKSLRAEKKKILEQVMDKETYKVAVDLLARFADKPSLGSLTTISASNSSLRTPSKYDLNILNRSLPAPSTQARHIASLPLTPSATVIRTNNLSGFSTSTPQRAVSTISRSTHRALGTPGNSSNQLVRRRTPFPVIDQQSKGVFEKIVDVLVGDGPGDRFAMICKDCFAHNGMALKEDFEYTTFRCAFCNALNPARKSRPAAPRLSHMPMQQHADSSSEEKEDTDDESPNVFNEGGQFSTPLVGPMMGFARDTDTTPSSTDDEQRRSKPLPAAATPFEDKSKEVKNVEKSDSAIDDVSMSPEEK